MERNGSGSGGGRDAAGERNNESPPLRRSAPMIDFLSSVSHQGRRGRGDTARASNATPMYVESSLRSSQRNFNMISSEDTMFPHIAFLSSGQKQGGGRRRKHGNLLEIVDEALRIIIDDMPIEENEVDC